LTDDVTATTAGTSIELTERIDVGRRFVVWRELSVTPTLGIGGHEDFDRRGRMAPFYAPTAMLGLELGWYLSRSLRLTIDSRRSGACSCDSLRGRVA
jgi:hypothetical protein